MTATPTRQPNAKDEFTCNPLNTTTKSTEQWLKRYFVKNTPVVLNRLYVDKNDTIQVGAELHGAAYEKGFYIYDLDGRSVAAVVPWENITTTHYCIVREYKTTLWEAV